MSGISGSFMRGANQIRDLGLLLSGYVNSAPKLLVLGSTVLLARYDDVGLNRSTDGGATQAAVANLPYPMKGAAVANGRFIILCSDGTNHRILYGTDGSTWTTVTPSQAIVCLTGRTVIWNGTNYICYAATNDANVRRIFATSADLTTWTLVTSGVNNSSYWEVVPYAGGFMGRTNSAYTPLGADGVTEGTPYTPTGTMTFGSVGSPNNTMISRGGRLFATTDTNICTTLDGVTWTTYTHGVSSLAAFNNGFVALGDRDVVFYAGSNSGQILIRQAPAGTGNFTTPSGLAPTGVFRGVAAQGLVAHICTGTFTTGNWHRRANL